MSSTAVAMNPERTIVPPDEPDLVLRAISRGHRACLITGNVHDLTVQNGEIADWSALLENEIDRRGYVVIRYSKCQGGRVHGYSSLPPKEKQTLDSRLNAVGLAPLLNRDVQHGPDELRSFFRGMARLLQLPPGTGKPIALVLHYVEHLAPAVQTSAAAADEQTFVAETLHVLANSPALRTSGNLLLCLAREGMQNTLLNDLHRVQIPFPEEKETEGLITLLLTRDACGGAPLHPKLERGLDSREFARLTRGLRLREVEELVRTETAAGAALTRSRVLEAKAAAIPRASEGTLAVETTSLTLDDIVGLETVKRAFAVFARKLRLGDPASPRAALLVGPPGTSKSTFAPLFGSLCGFNVLKFQNVKNMFVGESERRMNLALSVVQALAPSILFLDEITEMVPSRNTSVTDGGVSLDLLGQLFQFSARDDLRGKVLLLAASNVPERLDPAWHDRFITIPFLELLPDETRKLFPAFERRITCRSGLNPDDRILGEAARLLHQKGASPRKVFEVVSHALLHGDGGLTPDQILAAAQDYTGSGNRFAVACHSLSAIALASFQSYFPWSLDPERYLYPWYLEGLVDKKTGVLDRDGLQKRIQDYRRFANL